MDADNLVHMANRIGEFFAAGPDRQEAKDGIALHLRKFWEPRMRRALLAHIDAVPDSGLSALVLEAVQERRAELTPAEAAQPAP
jgi:formate dehydrogenase subunit delta